MDGNEQQLRQQILELTSQLVRERQARQNYQPGDTVPYAGRVYDESEVTAAVGSMLDFWLTLGPEGEAFERELAQYLGVRSSTLVNSGSSANLVAISALTSYKLGEKRLRPGDEVITAAAGFPATVTPIVQNQAVPVFLDVDPITANMRVDLLEQAYVPGKTKAVMIAHTLGNPFDLGEIESFCKEHDLWLVEDNCDALGSRYGGQLTGTFGHLSTQSFYPPHHLTMGEGGSVNVSNTKPVMKTIVESFRDWGRDCWCASGCDNTCNKRFGWTLGELPEGYDHKYIYTHMGYNLKPTDPQAAIGRAQLKKLPGFVQARVDNWNYLRTGLADLEEFFDFMLPTHATGWSKSGGFAWAAGKPVVEPSWFGFMMNVKPAAPFTRLDFARGLDAAKIGNRGLFGGNLLRQPAFVTLRKQYESGDGVFAHAPLRVVGDTQGADYLMNQAVFVGTFPGLTHPQLDYIIESIHSFVAAAKAGKPATRAA
jgi:CDP-6-deoxy-D-xylo-4-hexulose-3-dehydrase